MITKQLFEKLFPTTGLTSPKSLKKYNLVRFRSELIDALNNFLPLYEINTHKRVSAFLACCGVETDYFKTTEEYASGADYEGRKDLGNTNKGDGKRFKGSGVIQTTGRFNFERVQKRIGKKLGIDVVRNPEILRENIPVAVEAACIFWQENNLNAYADRKEFKQLNGIVNRGNPNKMPLHWAKRNELYSKCIRYIPKDLSLGKSGEVSEVSEVQEEILLTSQTSQTSETFKTQEETFKFDFSKASANYSRATATLQNPSVKTIGKKATLKLVGGLSAVWGTTSGRIALVLTALLLIAVAAGVIYSYRKPIRLGWQIFTASIRKTLKIDAAN